MGIRCSLAAVLGASVALSAGCATAPPVAPAPAGSDATAARVATAASSGGQVCRLERPTGSRVLTHVCRSPEEIAGDREAARTTLPAVVPAGRRQPPYATQ